MPTRSVVFRSEKKTPWEGHVLRGRTYYILIFLLLVGGSACICGSWPPSQWNIGQLSGAVTFMVAAAMGMLSIISARTKMRKLAVRVEKMIEQTRLGFIEANDTESVPLIAAVNDLITYVEKHVANAVMQVKELEIQLK